MESVTQFVNWQDFIAGWLAGIAALTIGHPFDTIKVRQQILHSTLLKAVFFTFRYEGPLGFYKGVIFPSFMIGPSNAVFFGVYGNCLKSLSQNGQQLRILDDDPHWTRNVFCAGVMAGFAQVLVTCPAEVVKTTLQMQTRNKNLWKASFESNAEGLVDCFRQIYKVRGLRGFFRGMSPMMFRDVPTSGIYTITYENMKNWDYYFDIFNGKLARQAIAGGSAGVFSWMLVIPFDVVKSQMQGDNPERPKYANMWDCAVKTYREGGWRRFTKGTTTALIRSFPCNAGIFVSYEYALEFFKKYKVFEPTVSEECTPKH